MFQQNELNQSETQKENTNPTLDYNLICKEIFIKSLKSFF